MELESLEWLEFGEIVKMLEETLNILLKPDLFNWSCFKNSAFRSENPEPEIHWHFIPRYKRPVTFEGLVFEDPDFGFIPQPIERKIPPEAMKKLKELLSSSLKTPKI